MNGEAKAGVVVFGAPLPPVEPYLPAPERILSGHPQQRAWILYQSPDGKYACGVWECEPGKWRVVFDEHEFCRLLEGEIVITGDDGGVTHVKAGDTFVTPGGFTGTWDVRARSRKHFVVYC